LLASLSLLPSRLASLSPAARAWQLGALALLLFCAQAKGWAIIGFDSRFVLFAQKMLRHGPSLFPSTYGEPYPDYPGTSTLLIYLLSLPFGQVDSLAAWPPGCPRRWPRRRWWPWCTACWSRSRRVGRCSPWRCCCSPRPSSGLAGSDGLGADLGRPEAAGGRRLRPRAPCAAVPTLKLLDSRSQKEAGRPMGGRQRGQDVRRARMRVSWRSSIDG